MYWIKRMESKVTDCLPWSLTFSLLLFFFSRLSDNNDFAKTAEIIVNASYCGILLLPFPSYFCSSSPLGFLMHLKTKSCAVVSQCSLVPPYSFHLFIPPRIRFSWLVMTPKPSSVLPSGARKVFVLAEGIYLVPLCLSWACGMSAAVSGFLLLSSLEVQYTDAGFINARWLQDGEFTVAKTCQKSQPKTNKLSYLV